MKDTNCALTAADLPELRRNIRSQFERHRGIAKNDFSRIEFLIRSGEKQLKLFRDPTVTGVSSAGN